MRGNSWTIDEEDLLYEVMTEKLKNGYYVADGARKFHRLNNRTRTVAAIEAKWREIKNNPRYKSDYKASPITILTTENLQKEHDQNKVQMHNELISFEVFLKNLIKEHKELQQKHNQLLKEHNHLKSEYDQVMDDNKFFHKIFNQARQSVVEETALPRTQFRMDQNGNLERY